MKLIRFGEPRFEKPGIIAADGTWRDVTSFTPDYSEEFFENDGINRLSEWLKEQGDNLPLVPQTTRLGPPVARCGKIVCVGLNFVDHAAEAGMDLPKM